MQYITKSANETKLLGRELAKKLRGGEVLCLDGDLGSGKTVFTSGIVDFFLQNKRVLSPTFTIVRHYTIHQSNISDIYHIDLYRIADNNAINHLGLAQIFGQQKVVTVVEWAQRLGQLIPKNRINISIKLLNENEREIIEEWI